MILKMSTRAGAKSLGQHLLNGHDNEHVEVHEVCGFVADTLPEAMQELYATAKATNVKKFMASMSINPPKGENPTIADFEDAVNRAEKELGLEHQPRAIVFHEKNGRRHAHAVWSRVDENLKAIKLDYYKKKLFHLSKQLYLEHGYDLPKGFENKKDKQVSYDLADYQQAKRNKLNPKEIKAKVIACWESSTDLKSFKQAIEKEGYILAKGDRKDFVLVDSHMDIKGLRRTLSVPAKEIADKLGSNQNLPTVDAAKTLMAAQHLGQLKEKQSQLVQRHAEQVALHENRINTLVKTQQHERAKQLALHEQRQVEERENRQAQYQKGLKALWHFVTGRYHKQKQMHEAEYQASLARDATEKDALIQTHINARETLQQPLNEIIERQQQEMQAFNKWAVQHLKSHSLKHEFTHQFEQETKPQSHSHNAPKLEL
ncbi:relaxase/mobilization nuclease domain-containing protein [Paraglaciecola marina]|uniref:relaxase/mobilization nuclease domain-containing protein n=1 Tax=Paraglaciecola marina TaxID=2500157 RepID=UPI001060314C|nr:relaxase [Paraglaciecola marina]